MQERKYLKSVFASGEIHAIVDLYPVCPSLLRLQGRPPVRGAALHEAFGPAQLPGACMSVARLGHSCRFWNWTHKIEKSGPKQKKKARDRTGLEDEAIFYNFQWNFKLSHKSASVEL